jgi:SnoaL-like protein
MSELDELRTEVARLRDRAAIQDLFAQYGAAMDAQDWELLRDVFAPDIVVDHTAERWGEGRVTDEWHGIDEVMKRMKEGVSRHFVSHHMMTNQRVELDGDTARAVTYLHSVHLDDPQKPDEHGDHGAWYLSELVRTADGWKISWLKHTAVWFAANMRPGGPATRVDVEEMRDHLRGSPVTVR